MNLSSLVTNLATQKSENFLNVAFQMELPIAEIDAIEMQEKIKALVNKKSPGHDRINR